MSITCFRIYTDNFADEDLIANFSTSSEQTAFPKENILNFQRRSKVWRSNGYWNITTSNNKIVFRETTSVDLTAILNTGIYNTSEFIAEIKRALESAGGSTYTVSQENLRFKVVSDGAGGGGIFELYVSGTTLATDLGLTSNKTGSLTYTMDIISITQEEYILFDFGISTNPSAFFMVDQRNSPIQIPPGATVKLEGNETNNFSTPSFTTTLTHDFEVFSEISDTGIASQAYRYWRVYFDEESAKPNGYIQVGAIFLGDYFSPSRGRAQFPVAHQYVDRTVTLFSESGASFSDIKEKTSRFNIEFKGLQKADAEEFDTFFNSTGTGKPFFCSMDTSANWSTNANRRIILCKFDSEPRWSLVSPDNFTLNFVLREEL